MWCPVIVDPDNIFFSFSFPGGGGGLRFSRMTGKDSENCGFSFSVDFFFWIFFSGLAYGFGVLLDGACGASQNNFLETSAALTLPPQILSEFSP